MQRVWVCIFEDGMVINQMTPLGIVGTRSFWRIIRVMFGLEPRTLEAIASQFKINNQQYSLWKTYLIKAIANLASGSNLNDLPSHVN
ncbi:unnamed protein product [Prunus armeniaca]